MKLIPQLMWIGLIFLVEAIDLGPQHPNLEALRCDLLVERQAPLLRGPHACDPQNQRLRLVLLHFFLCLQTKPELIRFLLQIWPKRKRRKFDEISNSKFLILREIEQNWRRLGFVLGTWRRERRWLRVCSMCSSRSRNAAESAIAICRGESSEIVVSERSTKFWILKYI